MASCKGSKKQYAGTIFKDNRDGTYDVKFDDGDRDRAVPERGIVKEGGSRPAAKSSFGGRSPVAKSRSGFGVRSDNDEEGKSSDAEKTAARKPVQRLATGTRVEANYRGRGDFLPGKILRARVNGTFDIVFVNGERELSVKRALIRHAGENSRSDDAEELRQVPAKLRMGDKVICLLYTSPSPRD